MTIKKILAALFGVIVIIIMAAGLFFYVYVRPFMKHMMMTQTIQYDKNLTIMLGGGGNSGILVSDSLVLVIDTKMDEAAKMLYDSVKKIAGNKPIIVVNTHVHTDHVKGNKFYKGQTIIAGGNYDHDFWTKEAGEATLPTQWVKDSLVLKVGDETVTILNLGRNAHTQSDVMVYLHNRKMLFGGDVILNKQCPAMFKHYNADSKGYVYAFDYLPKRFEIKEVVPGHGNIGGPEVIDAFRQYFKDMQLSVVDGTKSDSIQAKYKSWAQVPVMMSPGASIRYIKGEK